MKVKVDKGIRFKKHVIDFHPKEVMKIEFKWVSRGGKRWGLIRRNPNLKRGKGKEEKYGYKRND